MINHAFKQSDLAKKLINFFKVDLFYVNLSPLNFSTRQAQLI